MPTLNPIVANIVKAPIDGTASEPSISFGGSNSASSGTGFYLKSASVIGASVGGVEVATIGASAAGATGDFTVTGGNFVGATAGKGLTIKEGSNARMGVSTMVGGSVVVSNTSVTANTRIFLSIQSLGTVAAPKAIGVTARTASTSFTITSADATDTSVVAWFLMEPTA